MKLGLAEMTVETAQPVFERVDSQSLHHNVVQQLARQILNGRLLPGSTLPVENELAQYFGVSRTVVREAVRVLVSKGLLSVRQGSGMRVQPAERWNYLDPLILFERVRSGHGGGLLNEVLEVRRILEVEVAALAAVRCTEEDVAILKTDLSDMQASLADPVRFTDLDIAFHEHVLEVARNRLLREALRPVAETLQTGRFLTTQVPGGMQMSMAGHKEIFTAIKNRDVEAARATMLRHVQQFEHDIRMSLSAADEAQALPNGDG